jgi:tetratricopeptide (TPR) repeat protein
VCGIATQRNLPDLQPLGVPQAIEQAPSNALAYEARAKARIAVSEYEDALQDATNAVELDPQFAKAYLQQG